MPPREEAQAETTSPLTLPLDAAICARPRSDNAPPPLQDAIPTFGTVNLKSAVEALAFFDLRAEVASTWREAGRGAQEAAVEEGLKGARQDRPPSLQARQLLRILGQASQESGDGRKRLGGGLGLGVRAGHADGRLPRVARARRDR